MCFRLIFISLLMTCQSFGLSCQNVLNEGVHDPFVARLISMVGRPLKIVDAGSKKLDGEIESLAYGLPESARIRKIEAGEVFRHYSPRETLDHIHSTGQLRAGNLPYVIKGGGTRMTFMDLTGVFLTTPQFRPESVGVAKDLINSYIDFNLPAGTVVIQLEPGIILVPGPSQLPHWMKAYYLQYEKDPSSVPTYVQSRLEQIKAQGGILNPLEVPITILK